MMTSLEGMLKMADGVIAKRWQWRVSIDDPSFHDFFHTPLPPPKKKVYSYSYVYEASAMNLPQIPITMQEFRII